MTPDLSAITFSKNPCVISEYTSAIFSITLSINRQGKD
jgi:hypothetical protein